MGTRGFAIDQVVSALEEVADGAPIKAVCYRLGISRQTYNRWRQLYQGLPRERAVELHHRRRELALTRRRMRQLEDEIRILKQLDAWAERLPTEPGSTRAET